MEKRQGITVLRVPYTADPEKAAPEWAARQQKGYPRHAWAKEMEMDAQAGTGMSVFQKDYVAAKHERPLSREPSRILRTAFDFGSAFPARVWFQRTGYGGIRVLASTVGQNIQLRPFLAETVGFELEIFGDIDSAQLCYCDPAGNQPKDDGMKSIEVLRAYGFSPKWCGSTITEGLRAISDLLVLTQDDGEEMFAIDPRHNRVLCQAFRHAYKRGPDGTPLRVHPFIDPMDAFRYGVLNTTLRKLRRQIQRPDLRNVNPETGSGRWATTLTHPEDL
jgi:hypothetical protein